MKVRSVALLSALGMTLTSFSVYSWTTRAPGEEAIEGTRDGVVAELGGDEDETTEVASAGATFTAGSTLMVEGRLGHARMARDGRGETFVMLEVRGTDQGSASARAPVSLAVVVDRSGSMRGARLDNAIRGTLAAIDRLRDGDRVSVVAFDTRPTVVVPPTTIDSSSRRRVESDVRGIRLGGDTCISCGIEEGLGLLEGSGGDGVTRMILLSDGDANNGVRDVPGFRRIAQRARDRGVAVTTIGVDVEYNEKILSAIAQESNGRHYFVANDAGLARVFEDEANATTASVATGAEATIELAPGVELDRVFDRTFRRSGNKVIVPLGAFAAGEAKTVLLKVRVPAAQEGSVAVADVDLQYRDLVVDRASSCNGRLATFVTSNARDASSLDPVVEGRAQRSETASILKEANDLANSGRFAEAQAKVRQQTAALASAAPRAKTAAPADRKTDVDKDFSRQIAVLEEAEQGFASPPAAAASPSDPFGNAGPRPAPAAPTRASREAVKANEKNAFDMGF